ncbi:MAG: MATE family efflux transporter [Bacillota bacterium]|nr:MATE family efflux transporter [Bacillota bacterium]
MFWPLQRVFSVRYLLNPGIALGKLPKSLQAYKNVMYIAFPAMVELISVSLIVAVDNMMVGVVGPEAIAAVGLTTQPRMIFMCFLFALNVSVTAIVARRKGEQRQDDANYVLRHGIMIAGIAGVILALLAAILAKPIMYIAGAKSDTIIYATEYYRILMLSLLFQPFTLVICAAMRGIGKTKITLIVNVTANIVNIIGNYLLIGGNFGFPKLGVKGSAIATLVGNFVAFIMVVITIFNQNSYLKISKGDSFRFRPDILKSIWNLSSNALLEQLVLRFGFFIFARFVADLGTEALATHQICQQTLNITFNIGDALGVAATSLVGQNLGKKRPDLSMLYGKVAQRIAFSISTVLFALIYIYKNAIVGLFTTDISIIKAAGPIMSILALAQLLQTSQVIMAGSLRGAGDTKFVAMSSFINIGVVRPILSYLLIYPFGFGLVGAWVTICVDQTVRFIMLGRRFSGFKWSTREV